MRNKLTIEVNIYKAVFSLLLAIQLISCIEIPCLGNWVDQISVQYFIINLVSFALIILMKPRVRIDGYFKFIVLYYLVLLVSTILNGESLYLLIAETGMAFCTFLTWNSMTEEEFIEYMPVILFCLEVMTYINMFMVILMPEGLYNQGTIRKYFLFGHVNIAMRYLLPGCCFELIYSIKKFGGIKMRALLFMASTVITLALTLPMTGILGFGAFVICLILIEKLDFARIFEPIKSMIYCAILTFLIIVVQIQNLLEGFIVGVLNKDLSLTGRTEVWDAVLGYIIKSPIIGIGRLSQTERTQLFGATSAHNQFLIFLQEGGILLMTVIVATIISVNSGLKQCNNKRIYHILIATIFAYFVMWIGEPFSYSGTPLMFMVWMCAHYSGSWFNEGRD